MHAERRCTVLLEMGARDVDDMDEEVGDQDLLKGRLEGLDEPVRQPPNESHGVRQEELLVPGEQELAGGGVQGREQLVLGQHRGARQLV
jgi:hypothetical protein